MSLTGSRPATWPLLNELVAAKEELSEAIQSLGAAIGQDMNDRSDIQDLESTVNSLESNRSFLLGYPNLHDLYRSLAALGLEPIIDAVRSQDLNYESAVMALEHAWLSSLLNLLWIDLPSLARFSGDAQDNAVHEFRRADEGHVSIGAARVKRAWASTSVSTRDTRKHQSAVLVTQASLKPRSRQRLSLRDLYREAEDVLTSVKPCWVMSPLVVAQVLPAKKCFDLVVFDEASQIPPADAVCALLRGRQTVVAGDPKQLPPTTFFASGDRDEENDNEEQQIDDGDKALNAQVKQGQAIALVGGQESLLDQMKALLPPPHGTKMLNWHYRSKCERLIAFSNAQEELYDWQLTSFPSAGDGNCVSHVLAPFTAGAEEANASASAEVQEVVALVIRHAEERPDQSLGVIALGVYHANRIEEQLRRELESRKDLEEFFEKSGLESFFIRNLERVQGDERDAIILTTGYSKTKDGRMRYSFGPINRVGGYRRLNVAVTRAKLSMTVVSSFSSVDMDDEKLNSIGPRMLIDYLLYAESGGTNLGRRTKVKPQMNPFERDVYEALTRVGIRLTPQYGESGYWIDFAAMHPDSPGEPILAIETDGAMYHSSPTARDRDRLRQSQLGKLGWRFHRIWSTEWFRSREQEIKKLVQVYEDTLLHQTVIKADRSFQNESEVAALPIVTTNSEMAPAPRVPIGLSINNYSQRQLRSVVKWVKSDGRLRTEDELLRDVMQALGFKIKGSRIVAAIRAAMTT
jgi:very-short-patch-repair endonuclease